MADYSIAEKDNACFKHVYCHLFILGKEAKIARFEGLDYLKQMPEMMHLTEMKRIGDKVGVDGTSAQKVMGLHLKVNDFDHLKRVFDDVKEHFHFYDEEGNDLTIMFNKDRL